MSEKDTTEQAPSQPEPDNTVDLSDVSSWRGGGEGQSVAFQFDGAAVDQAQGNDAPATEEQVETASDDTQESPPPQEGSEAVNSENADGDGEPAKAGESEEDSSKADNNAWIEKRLRRQRQKHQRQLEQQKAAYEAELAKAQKQDDSLLQSADTSDEAPPYPVRDHYESEEEFDDALDQWFEAIDKHDEKQAATQKPTGTKEEQHQAYWNQQYRNCYENLTEILSEHESEDVADDFHEKMSEGNFALPFDMVIGLANHEDEAEVVSALKSAMATPRRLARIHRTGGDYQTRLSKILALANGTTRGNSSNPKSKNGKVPDQKRVRGMGSPSVNLEKMSDAEYLQFRQTQSRGGGSFQFS